MFYVISILCKKLCHVVDKTYSLMKTEKSIVLYMYCTNYWYATYLASIQYGILFVQSLIPTIKWDGGQDATQWSHLSYCNTVCTHIFWGRKLIQNRTISHTICTLCVLQHVYCALLHVPMYVLITLPEASIQKIFSSAIVGINHQIFRTRQHHHHNCHRMTFGSNEKIEATVTLMAIHA